MFLITEDNFCNKRVYDIKDSVIKIKDDRYVIYKDGREALSIKINKSMLAHDLYVVQHQMRDRYFQIEYLRLHPKIKP
jgi:hypothetical protein